MKIKICLVAVVGALSLLSAFGFVEELHLQEWVGDGSPLPGGWTHKKLIKGEGGAYFSSREGWLQSPVFDAAIRTVKIEVCSSNPNPRRMYLHPIVNGVTEGQGHVILPTEENQVYSIQEFAFQEQGANQFVIQFAPEGGSGNWWIRKVEVRFGDPGTDDDDVPRCWSLSAFVPRPSFRTVDFSMLGYVKANTANPWRNGLTIEGFHAFSDSGSCENIRLGNSSSPNSGLYAITSGVAGSAYALSVLGSSGSGMSLMLPIALDAERSLAQLSVEYRVWELSVEGRNSTLSFSYRTLDDLATMSAKDAVWTFIGDADWSTGKDACGSSRTVEFPVKNLRGAKFVCLRWSVPQQEKSSIVGISDVRVTGAVVPPCFMLTIR